MNMTLKKQLGLMATISVITVLLLSLIGYLSNHSGSIGSDKYNKIIYANELTADILPPPMYLVEMIMKVEQLGKIDASTDRDLVDDIKQHISEFYERENRWLKTKDLSPNLNTFIKADLDGATKHLVDLVSDEILPAVREGNLEFVISSKPLARKYFVEHKVEIEKLVSMANTYASEQAQDGGETVDFYQLLFNLLVALSIIIVVASSWLFSKDILNRLGGDPAILQELAKKIAQGDADVEVPNTDNADSVLGAFANMVVFVKDAVAKNISSTRILASLDATSTNVMIADENRNIIYLNESVTAMLRGVEKELQTVLPNFAVDKVLSSNMDIFHKNPAHQSSLLGNLTETYTSQIKVASLEFRLTATPIFSEDKQRLGTVVEWLDITQSIAEERRVKRILESLNNKLTFKSFL